MLMATIDETLTPQDIADGYIRCFAALHGKTPTVRHMGGHWYQVNGEIVHRSTLTKEILRLRGMMDKQQFLPERNLITRIINRLRRLQ